MGAFVVSELDAPDPFGAWDIPAVVLLLGVIWFGYRTERLRQRAQDDAAASDKRRLDAFWEVSERAIRGLTTQELFDATTAIVAEGLDVSHVGVLALADGGSALTLEAGVGWADGEVGTASVALDGDGGLRSVLAAPAPVTSDAARDPVAFPPLLRGHGIATSLSAVIRGEDERPYGLLAAYGDAPHVFGESDASFLRLAASMLTSLFRRNRLEAELAESEEHLRLALDVTHMGAWDVDLVTGETSWSPGLFELTGLTPHTQPTGELLRSLVHPEDRDLMDAELESAAETGDYEIETFRVCRPDGEIRRFFARGRLVRDPAGQAVRDVGVALDVTERTRQHEDRARLEEQLRQAQKMESIGQLAGGIAHDFNNLLLALRGYGTVALRALERGEDPRGEIEEMLGVAERAGALTRQLLAFSRRQVLEPAVLDLNVVVAEIERLLDRLIGEDVEVRAIQAPQPVCVFADRGQLEQVIANLAVNARDAMVDGGRLTIEVGVADVARRHELPLEPGRYAVLAVSDTGIGMDAETAAQIFEPFYTTKEGFGTGLGLSTAHGIVKQSGGHIWVYSEPGAGTTFKVYFPLVEDSPVDESLDDREAPHGKGETVLLVEDDSEVRTVVRQMLEEQGYRVLPAPDGHEAIRLAGTERVDLLVTDVVMRGLSGRQTAEQLRDLQPEIAVIYISGYTDDEVLRRGILGRDTAFLQKPFGSDDLARKVRAVLDRR
jgi:PAS domain S-box-containing protein